MRSILRILALLSLCLLGLGSFVRVTGAGLACPDWPLCWGEVAPTLDPGVLQEISHRYLAGCIGLLTFLFFLLAARKRSFRGPLFLFSAVILVLLFVQIILGALTVWLKLSPVVVTAHLLLGTVFFQILFVVAFPLLPRDGEESKEVPTLLRWTFLLLSILTLTQIVIGGLVSSGGAALACPAFPSCGAFGDELLPPQHLQMGHRYLAYLLLMLILAAVAISRIYGWRTLRPVTIGLSAMAIVQILIGAANVLVGIHPLLSVAHLVVAETILWKLLRASVFLSPQWRMRVRALTAEMNTPRSDISLDREQVLNTP